MNIVEALEKAERGQAVSRRGWGDPDKIVHAEPPNSWINCGVATGPQAFTQSDLEADDWFVVAPIH